MFSAIFIDDELLIRKQIASIFLWLDEEVELIDTFSNVPEAISFLQNHFVDMIIADIRLKNESGMELAKYVYENNLPSKVIMLSAYKSFEYAKEGYKYGVASYITKPLNVEELREVIQHLKKSILDSRDINNIKQNSAQYILDYFADTVPRPNQHSSSTKRASFLCRLDIRIKNHSDYDNNTLYQYIYNILQIYESPLTYVLTKLDGEKAIALIFSDIVENETDFRAVIEHDCLALNKVFWDTAKLHVEFDTSYLSIGMLNFSFNEEKSNIPMATYNDFILKSLVEHLQTDEPKKVLPVLRLIIDFLKTPQDKISFANRLFKKLNITVMIEELPEKQDFASYIIEVISEKIGRKSFSSHNTMISSITSYIEQNFYRDISLYDIANHMNMNPSYFSRYFKELFEINFSEYLVTFRVNKAKIFLKKSNASVDAIANAVGYNHRQAFYKNFKRITGMTPNEYRTSQKEWESD